MGYGRFKRITAIKRDAVPQSTSSITAGDARRGVPSSATFPEHDEADERQAPLLFQDTPFNIDHLKKLERQKTGGFTLVEIVVALGLLALGILGILSLFPVGLDAQKRALDYSNLTNLAEWKMADIAYKSHLTGSLNSLTAATSYPNSGVTSFDQNKKYSWHYYVSKPYSGTLDNLYRVDLAIYSVSDTTNPIEKVVSYLELPQ